MNRFNSVAAVALFGALALSALGTASAQTAAAPATTSSEAKPKAAPVKKPATPSRKEAKSDAKVAAPAPEATEPLSDNQLLIANRVLTGSAKCEFNQTVDVSPIKDKPGYFKVGFNKANYTMAPQETTTGAVRLEDKKAGVVWLQIPTKSMMMNHKIGQRMVDSCMHAEQQTAVNAVQGTTPQ